jgi:hypothetical protein
MPRIVPAGRKFVAGFLGRTGRIARSDSFRTATISATPYSGDGRGTEAAMEAPMRKYVIAWILGVPAGLLAVIYVVSHVACGR